MYTKWVAVLRHKVPFEDGRRAWLVLVQFTHLDLGIRLKSEPLGHRTVLLLCYGQLSLSDKRLVTRHS